MVAYICAAVNDPITVLSAAVMTAAIVVGLMLYAITSKRDFTFCGGLLFVAIFAFIAFGMLSVLFGTTVRMIYCFFGVVLFGIYLIADT